MNNKVTVDKLEKCLETFNQVGLSPEDIHKAFDNQWSNGFESAIRWVEKYLEKNDLISVKDDILRSLEIECNKK